MRNSILGESVSEIDVAFDTSRLLQVSSTAIVSVLIGIGIGLVVAWAFWPVEYVNADPSDLRQRYKDDYVRMIGAAYVADGNLSRAQERLKLLGASFSAKSFGDLLIREQKSGRDVPTLNALALLAQGMGFGAMTIPTPTPAAEVIISNNSPQPVQPVPSFQIAERAMLSCAEELSQARLQFIVRDTQGKDLPNIGIDVRWTNGEDTVYTGLKPERGAGYADFEAAPGNYTVSIANAQSETAENMSIGDPPANCRNDRGQTPRGWRLVFQQK